MSRHVAVSRAVMTIGVAGAFAGLAWADAVGLAGAAPAWWLVPVVLIVAVVGSDEFVRLCGARELRLPVGLMRTATVAVPLAALVGSQASAAASAASPTAPLGWSAVALALAIGAFFTREIAGYRPGNGGLERLAAATLLTAYLGLPLACMIGLRLSCTGAPGAARTGSDPVGIVPLVSLIAVVKAADVAAYVVGTLFGRRRLAPVLSPGKTRAGAVAALAGALGAAWLVLEGAGFEAVARPWGGWAVYGLALGIAGMLGDIAESLLKREAAAKDSGRMLGGLGGVLDLVDSLLFAAPVAWLLWTLGR